MKKRVLVAGLVIAVVVMLTGCVGTIPDTPDVPDVPDDCRFEQTLYQYESGTTIVKRNYVIFELCTLEKVNSARCESVFASIIDYVTVVFYYDGVQWNSWVPGEPFNTFDSIDPDTEYIMYVNADCIFIIE